MTVNLPKMLSSAPSLALRQGVVTVANSDGTCTVQIAGNDPVIVKYLIYPGPVVNDVVWLLQNGTDMLVIGTTRGDNWIRLKGSNGIYWQDWGGGWFMNDATAMRSYQDKTVISGAAAMKSWPTNGNYAQFSHNSRGAGEGYGFLQGSDGWCYISSVGDVTFNVGNGTHRVSISNADPVVRIRGADVFGSGDCHRFWSDGEAWHNSVGVGGDNAYNNGIVSHNGGIRVKGTLAFECVDYGGGWFMQDTVWLRVWNNKNIYTAGGIRGDAWIAALGAGLYLKAENDTTHRIYWHTEDAIRTVSWSYVCMEAAAHDHQTRCEAQTRHVNRANNAWRYSDAAGHTNFSDPRFKRNMRRVPLGKNKVKEIEPIEFQWDEKHDKREPGGKNFGFDASTLPDEVVVKSYLANEETGEPEECLMMDPVGVAAIAWQAIREVADQVEAMEERLASIERLPAIAINKKPGQA